MKGKLPLLLPAVMSLFFLGALAFGAFQEQEKKVTLAKCPPTVQATIRRYTAGATIREIEYSREGGRAIYEVEAVRNGRTFEFRVAGDGTYLGPEEEEQEEEEVTIRLEDAPGPVQAALRRLAGRNPIRKVTREKQEGFVEYEATYTVNGVRHDATVAPNGELLELERHLTWQDLPAAVRQAFGRRFPGVTPKEIVAVQKYSYELEVVVSGKEKEVEILPSGRIEEED